MKTSPRFDAARAQHVLLLGIAALTTGLTGYGLSQQGHSQPAQQAAPAQASRSASSPDVLADAPAAGTSTPDAFDYSFGDDQPPGFSDSGVQLVPQTQTWTSGRSMGRTRGS